MNFKQANYRDRTFKGLLACLMQVRGRRVNGKHNKLGLNKFSHIKFSHNKLGQSHDLPWYWIALLGLLLFINCLFATPAEAQLTKFTTSVLTTESTPELVIVDRSVEYADTLLADFSGELHLLILEEDQEPFEQINQVLAGEPLYSSVTIVAKASSSAIYIGGRWIDQDYLLEHQHSLATFAQQFARNSQLSLYTTNLTTSHEGGRFIGVLAELIQMHVEVIYIQAQQYEPLWVQRSQFSF